MTCAELVGELIEHRLAPGDEHDAEATPGEPAPACRPDARRRAGYERNAARTRSGKAHKWTLPAPDGGAPPKKTTQIPSAAPARATLTIITASSTVRLLPGPRVSRMLLTQGSGIRASS